MRRTAIALFAALALGGCGDQTSISGGGRVGGDTLTVYSFLPKQGPRAPASRQIELGEKLALQQAGGRAGAFTVNYVAEPLPVGRFDGIGRPEDVAQAVRDVVLDQGVIAVLGDLDSTTARTTVPLFDAAGILHLSPGASGVGFANPTGKRRYNPLVPDDDVQAHAVAELLPGPLAVEAEGGEAAQHLGDRVVEEAGEVVAPDEARTVFYAGSDPVNAEGTARQILDRPRVQVLFAQELSTTNLPQTFAGEPRARFVTAAPEPTPEFTAAFREAFPDVEPDALAMLGYLGMQDVLTAIEDAGEDARSRQAVIDAYFARPHPARPFRFVR